MYAGALTLTQPLYMGGKIRAYNKITKYAEELARQQHNTGMQEVILSTDQAYWQVVSLAHKKKLAEGYLKLLQKLDSDVDKMIAEGVATKADGLSIKVKVNEAEMTLTKSNRWPEPCPDAAVPIVWSRPFHSRHAHRRTEGRPGSHYSGKPVPSTSTMFMLPVPKCVAWNLPRRFISRK